MIVVKPEIKSEDKIPNANTKSKKIINEERIQGNFAFELIFWIRGISTKANITQTTTGRITEAKTLDKVKNNIARKITRI